MYDVTIYQNSSHYSLTVREIIKIEKKNKYRSQRIFLSLVRNGSERFFPTVNFLFIYEKREIFQLGRDSICKLNREICKKLIYPSSLCREAHVLHMSSIPIIIIVFLIFTISALIGSSDC